MTPTTTDDRALADVAHDLYAVLPAEFVTTRDERVKSAKTGGDADLAARVKKLRKPSAAAWALNQVARHAVDGLDDVADLGRQMREAQEAADGKALRSLGRELRGAVDALARRAAALAQDAGQPLSGTVAQEVADTLRAVGVDPGVAVAVRSGLLVGAVTSTGLDRAEVEDAVAVPSVLDLSAEEPADDAADDDGHRAPVADLDAARTRRADREAARAREKAAAEHRRALGEARTALAKAERAATSAHERHDTARAALDDATTALAEAQEHADAARDAEQDASRRADEADAAATEAADTLRALEDDTD